MTAQTSPAGDTSQCALVAIVGETTYPCHHHVVRDQAEGHVFAADLPDPCLTPFCRLPAGHRSLHDIPSGRATFADAVSAGGQDPR